MGVCHVVVGARKRVNKTESDSNDLPRSADPDTPVKWPVMLASDTDDMVRYGGYGERVGAM